MGKGHTKLMYELKGNHKIKIKHEEEVAKAMDDATDCMDFDIKDYYKEPRVIKNGR